MADRKSFTKCECKDSKHLVRVAAVQECHLNLAAQAIIAVAGRHVELDGQVWSRTSVGRMSSDESGRTSELIPFVLLVPERTCVDAFDGQCPCGYLGSLSALTSPMSQLLSSSFMLEGKPLFWCDSQFVRQAGWGCRQLLTRSSPMRGTGVYTVAVGSM